MQVLPNNIPTIPITNAIFEISYFLINDARRNKIVMLFKLKILCIVLNTCNFTHKHLWPIKKLD